MSRFKQLEFDGSSEKRPSSEGDAGGLSPRDEKYLHDQAVTCWLGGDFELALRNYSRSLEVRSGFFEGWAGQIRMLIELGEYAEARKWADKAMELFPEQPLPFLFTGLADLQLKKDEDALKILTYGAKLVVDDNDLLAQFYMYQGDASHALKNEQEAFRAYEKSIQLKDDNAYVLNNYAYYLSLRGTDLDKAEKMAKKAVSLEPQNASFQDTYGWVLFKQEKYREASEWILKAVQSKEDASAEVLEHYGDVLYKLGDASQALEYWIKAKQKGPGSELLDKKIADKKIHK